MIDIAPLYKPITHSYKGVYPAPNGQDWDAFVYTAQGKWIRKGRFSSQEEAARAVASYYHSIYGDDWYKKRMEKDGRKQWRVKKVTRFLHMAASHRGPKTIVYKAEVQLPIKRWVIVTPTTILQRYQPDDTPPSVQGVLVMMWHADAEGWVSSSAAVVAIRMWKATQERLGSEPPTAGGAVQQSAPIS